MNNTSLQMTQCRLATRKQELLGELARLECAQHDVATELAKHERPDHGVKFTAGSSTASASA